MTTALAPMSATLQDYLVYLRGTITASSLGFRPPSGRGRRAPGLTQAQTAEVAGLTPLQYARIERMDAPPTEGQLDQIAAGLKLGATERSALYAKALGREPRLRRDERPDSSGLQMWAGIIPSLGQFDDGPIVYLTDAGWDLVSCNLAFMALFPDRQPPANVIEWMLWDGVSQMPDHERAWRIPVLAQLDQALTRFPGNERLKSLMHRVQADPETRQLLADNRHLDYSLVHPDGDVRPFIHAGTGERGVLGVGAATPLGSPGSRVVFMDFTTNMTPTEYRAHQEHCRQLSEWAAAPTHPDWN